MKLAKTGLLFLVMMGITLMPLEAKKQAKKAARRVTQTQQVERVITLVNRESKMFQRESYVDALCTQFSVPLSVVEDLYAKNIATGKITLMLAMAQQLSQRDSTHFATTADALFQIQRERATGKTWTRIAHDQGLWLAGVLDAARQSLQQARDSSITENARS